MGVLDIRQFDGLPERVFAGWRAFMHRVEPIGEDRADLRNWLLSGVLCQLHGAKGELEPERFHIRYGGDAESEADAAAMSARGEDAVTDALRAFVAAHKARRPKRAAAGD